MKGDGRHQDTQQQTRQDVVVVMVAVHQACRGHMERPTQQHPDRCRNGRTPDGRQPGTAQNVTDQKVTQKGGGTHGETGMSRRKTVLRFTAPKRGIGAGARGRIKLAEGVEIGTGPRHNGFERLCHDFRSRNGGKNGRQCGQNVGNASHGKLKQPENINSVGIFCVSQTERGDPYHMYRYLNGSLYQKFRCNVSMKFTVGYQSTVYNGTSNKALPQNTAFVDPQTHTFCYNNYLLEICELSNG